VFSWRIVGMAVEKILPVLRDSPANLSEQLANWREKLCANERLAAEEVAAMLTVA
jgi:hypothetical protein